MNRIRKKEKKITKEYLKTSRQTQEQHQAEDKKKKINKYSSENVGHGDADTRLHGQKKDTVATDVRTKVR